MNLDRRLLSALRPVRGALAGAVVFGALAAAAIVVQALFISRILARVFLDGADISAATPWLIALAAAGLSRTVFVWAGPACAARLGRHVKIELRRRLLRQFERLGPARLDAERSGELAAVLQRGVDAVDVYATQYLPQVFLFAVAPLVLLVPVWRADGLTGLILLLAAPLIPLFLMLIGRAAQRRTDRQWGVLSRLGAHFLDVLQGLTTLKILGRSAEQGERIAAVSDEFRRATMKVLRVAFLSAFALELIATLSVALVAVTVGIRLMKGWIDYESALFVLLLAPDFFLPLRSFGAQFHAGMEGVAAARRIFQALETPPPDSAPPRAAAPPAAPPELRFEGVKFAYAPDARPALDAASFALPAGRLTALVGASGAGKSTALRLLLRFAEPHAGRIAADGRPLTDWSAEAWRAGVAWAPQRPYLFHGTLAENIALADPRAPRARIVCAAEAAGLGAFLAALPRGLDTPVGERALRLSGGQAQRLALARAFFKDAPVLLLDEPTSFLDPETEADIRAALRRLAGGRTTLLVAHRMTTACDADRVVVLDAGRVAEEGAPRDLAARGGAFARLLRKAAGEDA